MNLGLAVTSVSGVKLDPNVDFVSRLVEEAKQRA